LPSTRKNFCASLHNIGDLYNKKGMLAEAINVLEECLAAQRVFLSPDHQHIGITLWHLGELYKARDDLEKATEMWRDCLSVFEKCLPSAHPHLFRGKHMV
jgi:tetratricopeptide (TPR) repeat protein